MKTHVWQLFLKHKTHTARSPVLQLFPCDGRDFKTGVTKLTFDCVVINMTRSDPGALSQVGTYRLDP